MNLLFLNFCFVIFCVIIFNTNLRASGKRICESLQLDDDEIEDGSDTSRFVCQKKYEPMNQNGEILDDSIGELSAFEDDWPDYYGEDLAQDQEDGDNEDDDDINKINEDRNRPLYHQPGKTKPDRPTASTTPQHNSRSGGDSAAESRNNLAEDSSFHVDAEEFAGHYSVSNLGDEPNIEDSAAADSDCYPWDTGENHSSGRSRCTRRGRAGHAQSQTGPEADLELVFIPPKLVFFDNPISIPKMLEFSVQNPGRADIHIFSMSCTDVQFYPVMFQPKVVPSNGVIILQLLFLPYHIESSVSELVFATSSGQFYYPIEGHAVINPYRLHPLIGYRFPSGASKIDVPIVIYNPHDEALHIREVFTTEDFLALKGIPAKSSEILSSSNNRSAIAGGVGPAVLPPSTALLDSTASLSPSSLSPSSSSAAGSGSSSTATLRIADSDNDSDSSADSKGGSSSAGGAKAQATADDMAWLVQPGLEKEIITLSISKAMAPGDYKGYLHVKTDRDNIVLPVELQVLEGGVHCAHDLIDFGLLTAVAEQKSMQLWLLNSGFKNLQVIQILPADPDPHLHIQLVPNPIVYSATGDNPEPCLVASLTYTASNPGKVHNRLLVWTNSSNAALAEVEVPYTVTILHGGVGFDHQRAVFVVPPRNLSFLSMIRRNNKVRFRISRCDECTAVATLTSTGNDSVAAGAVEQTGRFRSGSLCRRDISLLKSLMPVEIVEREFLLTNYFSVPVTLQMISVGSCAEVLSVDKYNRSGSGGSTAMLGRDGLGSSAASLSKWPPIMIYFNLTRAHQLADSEEKFLPKTCWAEILTNVSSHRVPLHIVDAALLLSFTDALMIEDALDVHRYQSMKFPCGTAYLNHSRLRTFSTSSPPSTSLSSAKDAASHLLPQRGSSLDVATENSEFKSVTIHDIGSNVQQQKTEKKFSCSSSLLNSDEYHVDLGNLSVHEPRNLRVAFSNENPVRIALEVESASHDLCFCFESSWPISFKEDEAAAGHISSLKGRSFQEALAEPARCSCAGRDGPLTPTPPAESAPYQSNRSGPSLFDSKKAKSSYHSLFSVVIAEPLSSTYSGVSEAEAGAESEPEERSAVPCGKQRVLLSLTSPFQQIKLYVYFTAVNAKLSTTVAADDDSQGGVFLLGMERHLKLSTSSSFDETIKEPQFALKGDNFSLFFAASLNNKPFIKIRPKSTVTYAVHPVNMCNDYRKSEGSGMSNLWNCSYSILSSARLRDGAASMNSIADEFKYLEPAMMDIKAPASAYKIRQRLKRKWLSQFPSGLPLPPVDVVVQTPQTRHVHRVDNTTMQSPLAVMADLYSLRLPICSTGDMNWFYINVFNPFKFPVSFSLHQSKSGSSSSSLSPPPQPQRKVNFTAMELDSSSLNSRPETISAQGWFNCDISDALREDLEEGGSATATATEATSPASNTEGRILSVESPADASSFFVRSTHNTDASHRFTSPASSSSSSEDVPPSATSVHSTEELSQMCNGGDAAGLQNLVSLVRGVTLHRIPRSKDSNQRSASRVADEDSNGEVSSPFIVHSLSSAEWVALPYSTARIGPIMMSSKDTRSQGNAAVFYVFNNFTGFDKVEVQGSFGVAQLVVSQVSRDNRFGKDKRRTFNLSSESLRNDLFLVRDVAVSSLSDRFLVTVRNDGAVSTTIHDAVVGGRSCGSVTSWLPWQIGSGGGGLKSLCDSLPLQVRPNEEVSLTLTPTTSCAYLSKSESVVLLLDDRSGAFSSIEMVLDFSSADSIQEECLNTASAGLLRWFCLVVAAASFVSLCLLFGRGVVTVSAMWMKQRKSRPDLLRHFRSRKRNSLQADGHSTTASTSLLQPVDFSLFPTLPVGPNSSAGSADLSDVSPHSSDLQSFQPLTLAALRSNLSSKEKEAPLQLPMRMKSVELLISKRKVPITAKTEDNALRKTSTSSTSASATTTALPASKLPPSKGSSNHSAPSGLEGEKPLTSSESSRNHSANSSLSPTQTDGASSKPQRPVLFLNLEDNNFAELSSQSAHPLPVVYAHYNESPDASSLTGTTSSTDESQSFQTQNNAKPILKSPSPSPAWEIVADKGGPPVVAKDEKASFTTVPAKKKPQKEKGKQPKASAAAESPVTVPAPAPVPIIAAKQVEAQATSLLLESSDKVAASNKTVRTGKGNQAAGATASSIPSSNGNGKAAPASRLVQSSVAKKPAPPIAALSTPAAPQSYSQIAAVAQDTETTALVSPGVSFLSIVADAKDALSQEQQRLEQRAISSTPDSSVPLESVAADAIKDQQQAPLQQHLQPTKVEVYAGQEQAPMDAVSDPPIIAAPSFHEPEPEPEQDKSMSLWADDLDLDEVAEFLRSEQEKELLAGKIGGGIGGLTEPLFMTGLDSGFLGLGLGLGRDFHLGYQEQLVAQLLGPLPAKDDDAMNLDSPLFSYQNELLLLDPDEDAAEIAPDHHSKSQKQETQSGRSSFTGDSLQASTEVENDLSFTLRKTTELNPEATPYISWASRQGQSALPLHSSNRSPQDLSTSSLDLGLGSFSSQQSTQPYRGGMRLSGGGLDGLGLGMGLESISNHGQRGAGSASLISASLDANLPYSRQAHSRNRSLNSRGVADSFPSKTGVGLGLGRALGPGSLEHREQDTEFLEKAAYMKSQHQPHASLSSFGAIGKTQSRYPHGYEDRLPLSLNESTLSVSPSESLNYLSQVSPRLRLGAQAPPPGLDSSIHNRRLARSPYDMDIQPQGLNPATPISNPARSYWETAVTREGSGSAMRFPSSRGQGGAPASAGRSSRLPVSLPTSFLGVPAQPSLEDAPDDEEDDERLFFHCKDFDDSDGGSGSGSGSTLQRSLISGPSAGAATQSNNSAGTAPSRIFSSSSPPHRMPMERDTSSDWDWALSSRFAAAAQSTNSSHLRAPGPPSHPQQQQQQQQQQHNQPQYHSQSLSSSREQFAATQRGFGPAPGSGSSKKL